MLRFILDNLRWLAAGFLLTFVPASGQPWVTSLQATRTTTENGPR
mgnify:CR=1 FL=1